MKQLKLFLDSIRSPYTRKKYDYYLKVFGHDKLKITDPKEVEALIIQMIIERKKKGDSYANINNYVCATKSFYLLNDVNINVRKIGKFMPEHRLVKRDRSYTYDEIHKMLDVADLRGRALILILASSGCRLGAIPDLKLRNLKDNRLTIYENDREEYYTFVSHECKHAIDSYLDYRSRCGERLKPESPLIRDEFNVNLMSKPKAIKRNALYFILDIIAKKAGVRTSQVTLGHGFRKFFTTQVVNSKVNPETRELLLGHKIGLTGAYYRPSPDEIYAEYEKAIDNLTINQENRLNKVISEQKSIIDVKFAELEKLLKKVKEKEAMLKHA
jgi:integrase/recombinase XerD